MTLYSPLLSLRRVLLLLGAALALAAGALAAGSAPPAAAASLPCDIYASGGTPCVAAHSTTRALYASLQRAAVPGEARIRRHHDEHQHAQRGRVRQRGGAGLVLLGHHVHDHRDLRPVRSRQQPHRRAGRRGGGRPGQPRERDRGAGHGRRPRRSTASTSPPATGYRDDSTSGIATGDAAEGEYAIFDGTARQQRLLLRLRQRRDQQRRQRRRRTWKRSTSAPRRPGASVRATGRGSWPTWRTACSPARTPA